MQVLILRYHKLFLPYLHNNNSTFYLYDINHWILYYVNSFWVAIVLYGLVGVTNDHFKDDILTIY